MTSSVDALKNAIGQLRGESTRGSTAVYDGVIQGLDILKAQARNRDRAVVLFTDGENNSGQFKERDAISAALDAGIPIFTVGLTRSIDPVSLTNLAVSTEGAYLAASDITTLARSFTTIVELLQGQADTVRVVFPGEHSGLQDLTVRLADGRSVVLDDLAYVEAFLKVTNSGFRNTEPTSVERQGCAYAKQPGAQSTFSQSDGRVVYYVLWENADPTSIASFVWHRPDGST